MSEAQGSDVGARPWTPATSTDRAAFESLLRPDRRWEDAFTDQRAWVSLLAREGKGRFDRGEHPPPLGGENCYLYNQVHVTYAPTDILAIIYMNDTATRGAAGAAAARAAHEKAARWQRWLAHPSARPPTWKAVALDEMQNDKATVGRSLALPVVQMRIGDECFDASAVQARTRRASELHPQLGANTLFFDAPGPA